MAVKDKDIKDVYNSNKPSGGGGELFLRTNDGDNIRIRFLGLPAVFDSTFVDPKTKETKVTTKYA
jgi:hypothetical protein